MKFTGNFWIFRFGLTMVLVFFFCMGLIEMDYGTTFKEMPEVVGQGLLFTSVNARVMYHMGLIQVLGSFFIMMAICAYYLSKDKVEQEVKKASEVRL